MSVYVYVYVCECVCVGVCAWVCVHKCVCVFCSTHRHVSPMAAVSLFTPALSRSFYAHSRSSADVWRPVEGRMTISTPSFLQPPKGAVFPGAPFINALI